MGGLRADPRLSTRELITRIAPQRTPPFEAWGILIKVFQATILGALVYLVIPKSAVSGEGETHGGPPRRAGRSALLEDGRRTGRPGGVPLRSVPSLR
jgi:hypothetical protein